MSKKKCDGSVNEGSYINCPNCDALIFEKNLCRHMSSNRCKQNSNKSGESSTSSQPLHETNRSMLHKLVDENKHLKEEVEKRKHENYCAEKLFLKLMESLQEGKPIEEIEDELNFKHDQCTQTDEHVHHIDF